MMMNGKLHERVEMHTRVLILLQQEALILQYEQLLCAVIFEV